MARDGIHAEVKAHVLLTVRRMPDTVRASLKKGVAKGAALLARTAKLKVSGPVLKNRTGTLRRKIHPFTRETATQLTGGAGVNLSYAARHEYGYDGLESVREHVRHITQAFGRPIAPTTVTVHGFQRHAHTPERSFLRSSLREQAPTLAQILRASLAEGIAAARGAA